MTTSKPGGSAEAPLLAPLRVPAFRWLWLAGLLSNVGFLIQAVAAAWLMTQMTTSPQMVALVQTANQLPILVFALLAGALADLFDRRLVLIVAQVWMCLLAFALTGLAYAGLLGPWTLLGLIFLMGAGLATNGPAFQASVRELVPPVLLASAVTLNAAAFNLARAAGPAAGGAVVAAAGAETAFLINALSFLPFLLVLVLWRRAIRPSHLPRERVLPAVATGLRYVGQTPAIWHAMGRGALFGLAATAIMSLLPLIARDELGGGATAFGLLLGAFGAGALVGAFVVHPLRTRFGTERPAAVMAGAYGGGLLVVGLLPEWVAVVPALVLMGGCWLGSLSSFNIAVQLSTAFWVQARVLAIYQTVLFGGMALGSWFWGLVAEVTDLRTALIAAGVLMLGQLLLQPLLALPSGRLPDLRPARRAREPAPEVPLAPGEGPILVQIEYDVAPKNAAAFVVAMDEVGHLRRRNGAVRWRLFQDTSDPAHWVEAYLVADWLDHRRLQARTTEADLAVEAQAHAFHEDDGPPQARRMIARRHDSRFVLDPEERERGDGSPRG